MSRVKVSPFPQAVNTSPNKKRAKLRLSSVESFHRVYDNKTYQNQLVKLFDPLLTQNYSSKKQSPSKLRDIYTNFVTPAPQKVPFEKSFTMNFDVSREEQNNHAADANRDNPISAFMSRENRGSISVDAHKRTLPVLSNIERIRNMHRPRRNPTPTAVPNPLEMTHGSLPNKPSRRASSSIRTQLFQAGKRSLTPNSRLFSIRTNITTGNNYSFSLVRYTGDASKDVIEQDKEEKKQHKPAYFREKQNVIESVEKSDKNTEGDHPFGAEFMPNKEDLLIIKKEIQDSQSSLLQSTSENLEVEEKKREYTKPPELLSMRTGSVRAKNEQTSRKASTGNQKRAITPGSTRPNTNKNSVMSEHSRGRRLKVQNENPKGRVKKEVSVGEGRVKEEEGKREKLKENIEKRTKVAIDNIVKQMNLAGTNTGKAKEEKNVNNNTSNIQEVRWGRREGDVNFERKHTEAYSGISVDTVTPVDQKHVFPLGLRKESGERMPQKGRVTPVKISRRYLNITWDGNLE